MLVLQMYGFDFRISDYHDTSIYRLVTSSATMLHDSFFMKHSRQKK